MVKYRRLVWSIAFLALAVLLSSVFLSLFLKTKLRQEINNEIAVLTKDKYIADYNEFNINLFTLSASIRDFSLKPRPEIILSDSNHSSLFIEKLNISQPSFSWIFGKKSSVPKFNVTISDLRYTLPDSLYYVEIDNLGYNWQDSSLFIQDLKYKSFVDEYQFAYHDPKHSDWMDIELGSFQIENIALEELMRNKSIFADQISLDNMVFRNYKNKKIDIEHHFMPILYEKIQGIPHLFRIQKVLINNLSIYYQEMAKNGTDPGEIFFTKINIESQNFTNIPTTSTQMNRLDLSGKLMEEGQIKAQLYFPVDTAYDHAEIKGTLGPMAMISLNKIIEPLSFFQINGGMIQGMDFHITGNKEKANIDMCLLYKDLSIKIYRQNDGPEEHENIFLSVLANNLIMKDNPENGETPRRVYAEYERDPLHSSFNYLWKIVYSGLAETLGYSKAMQERVNWLREEVKKVKDIQ